MSKTAIVMVSGGVGSFVELENCVNEYGNENIVALFADTKMEDEDLYRFLDDSIQYLQCRLITIQDGRDVWEIFEDVKFIGNTRIDPCSKILKRDLLNRWVRDNYKPEDCVVHFGIDYTEAHRLERVIKRQEPYIARSIMVEQKTMMGNREKIQYCIDRGIEPPRLYSMGFSHNNCGGFCVKAGLAQFKLLLQAMPERYEWHVQRENKVREKVKNVKPFLRKQTENGYKYFWLSEYRDYLRDHQLTGQELFDYGGCGCALE